EAEVMRKAIEAGLAPVLGASSFDVLQTSIEAGETRTADSTDLQLKIELARAEADIRLAEVRRSEAEAEVRLAEAEVMRKAIEAGLAPVLGASSFDVLQTSIEAGETRTA